MSLLDKVRESGILTTEEFTELEQMVAYDLLTGLKNLRSFETEFELECKKSDRIGYNVALLMIDLDHFKQYNDTYGHKKGDEVLKDVADAIKGAIRSVDTAYRLHGEEMTVILPNADKEQAYTIAERVRKAVETTTEATISVGIAVYKETSNTIEDTLSHSDQAVYKAKNTGRNNTKVKQ